MFYLDASFVVSALTEDEVSSQMSRDWLRANPEAPLLVSQWVDTEVRSAISQKIRTGEISLEQRAALLTQWKNFKDASTLNVEIESDDFETASRFVEHYSLSLRASDALHVAIAYGAGCTLVTLDKRMAEAAVELGIQVAEV